MSRFKLVPYVVRLQQTRTKNPVPLHNIDGHGMDFLHVLQQYLQDIQQTKVLQKPRKTISVEKMVSESRDVFGVLKSGEYGIEADFHDVDSGQIIPRARKERHSEVLPFFFHFHLPRGMKGLLILQMFKALGVKTNLQRTLNEHLKPMGIHVELNRLISQNLLEQIEKSRLVELRLIRYDVPMDIADKVHNGDAEEIIEERVYRVKRNKNLSLPQAIKDLLSDRQTAYYEILDEKYNEIKAIIQKGRSKITLTFGENDIFREFMALDEEDMPLDRGYPTYDYLKVKSKDYLEHLQEHLGGD